MEYRTQKNIYCVIPFGIFRNSNKVYPKRQISSIIFQSRAKRPRTTTARGIIQFLFHYPCGVSVSQYKHSQILFFHQCGRKSKLANLGVHFSFLVSPSLHAFSLHFFIHTSFINYEPNTFTERLKWLYQKFVNSTDTDSSENQIPA